MGKKTLFLDRDGVINRQIIGGYVTNKNEFEFLPGVLDALALLATRFDYVFIVTNQQGIGKGIFSEKDLEDTHTFMLEKIQKNGGKIDKIYFCSALEKENSDFRKPAPGMGFKAKADFPEVDFQNAVMVGDSLIDMQFAKNLNITAIYLTNGKTLDKEIKKYSDGFYFDLNDFANHYQMF
jgi:D-glycero-D-manno-heptose 1,7-bisphosphate phosphatase